jgi:uncharacterized protein YndB with AHSA1/START domain
MLAKPSLTIRRHLKAPPDKVFSAWTQPDKLSRWFGPEGIEVIRSEIDLRIGGRWVIVGKSPDGEEHHVSGVYREVVENQRLVFTWAWRSTPERESIVSIDIRPEGAGTTLTLTHEQFFDEPARDRHQWGWTQTLDKLERALPTL